MRRLYTYMLVCFLTSIKGDLFSQPAYDYTKLKKEKLGRGFITIREDGTKVKLSWRYRSSDSPDISFHIYRISVATQNIAYNQHSQPGFYRESGIDKIFPEKEIETPSDIVTLKTGMEYDSYKWSNGETTQTVTVLREDTPSNKKNTFELEVIYRGCVLKDHVNVTFLK